MNAVIDKPATSTEGDQISYAARGLFVPSLTNRKNFNPAKLTALAETIKAFGIQSPLIVRKLPGSRMEETTRPRGQKYQGWVAPIYEIVAGERRWLAAGIAGLEKVPFILRELTDSEALDIQLIENLAREDLTPLEEGEAFAHRINHGGLTADQVGAKVGRSREYVYSKTKLLDLCMEAKDALRAEKIDASHALRIARIPDTKLQIKALAFATEPKPGGGGDRPSVSEFQRWLQQNVLLHLDKAIFKITDIGLVKDAGSCKECPKRTGANPELFSDVEGRDICTDPACFNSKTTAHRAALMDKAEKKGMRVIDGAEAKKICSAQSGALKGYSPLTQQRMDADGRQLGKLLGDDAPDPVLIENPYTKELIKAVPTVEAEAVLLAKGLIKVEGEKRKKENALDEEVTKLKVGMERACQKASRKAMFAALEDAIYKTPADKAAALISPTLLRAWLQDAIYHLGHEDTATVLQVTVDKNFSTTTRDAVELRLQACDDASLYKSLALFMVLDERDAPLQKDAPHPLFDALAGTTKVNLQKVHKDAVQAVKDETYDAIRTLKEAAKPGKKGSSPTTPLAQPMGSAPATAIDGAKPTLKKGKTTTQEAISGIAEAMQGIEGKAAPAALQPVSAWPFPPKAAKTAAPSAKPAEAAKSNAGAASKTAKPAELVDPLDKKAATLVKREQKASVRLLKTELGIGHDTARAVLDRLEAAGVVSACSERGARTVLVSK
ncbi:MAG: ParB/RepB/Spo0J family partition protein [Pseudomonadota bacterium]